MANTLILMKQRDRKENDLGILEIQESLLKEKMVSRKKNFEKKLAEYKEWKTKNNIEGVKY